MVLKSSNVDIKGSSCSGSSAGSSWTSTGSTVDNQAKNRKKKTTTCSMFEFDDDYELTGEILGSGTYGRVETCRKRGEHSDEEYAVKIIDKIPGFFSRSKVLREIETFHLCRGHKNIIELIKYYEEQGSFYLIFEKIEGGPLLDHLKRRNHFTEREASNIIRDLGCALSFLHKKGIAHRDLKPENVLCIRKDSPCPVKLGDFDLCSAAVASVSTPKLVTPVGSLEYMAPEVLDAFMLDDFYDIDEINDEEDEYSYDKRCDIWSLGVIAYILLCGNPPFSGNCGRDCGWDRGESCQACQSKLSSEIKAGVVAYNSSNWELISEQAKDLLNKLLVRDANQRMSAKELLNHPWILEGSSNILKTPSMLRRHQSSIQDLSDFAKSAMTLRRTLSSSDNTSFIQTPNSPRSIPIEKKIGKLTLRSNSFDFTTKSKLLQRRIKGNINRFSSIDENN